MKSRILLALVLIISIYPAFTYEPVYSESEPIKTADNVNMTVREFGEELRAQASMQMYHEQLKIEYYQKCDIESARAFVGSYVPHSPMIDYIDVFFESGDCNKAIIALAIAGNESLYGTTTPYINAWGYGCNYGGRRFDCGWTEWDYAIRRYMEIADNYLSLYDGTRESIKQIAYAGYYSPGMDGASVEMVEGNPETGEPGWVGNVYWFANSLQ